MEEKVDEQYVALRSGRFNHFPVLTCPEPGKYWVAWRSLLEGNDQVQLRRVTSLGEETESHSLTFDNPSLGLVVAPAQNGFKVPLLAWSELVDGSWKLILGTVKGNGEWERREVPSPADRNADPAILRRSDGSWLIAWCAFVRGMFHVLLCNFDGIRFSEPELMSIETVYNHRPCLLAVDTQTIVLAWDSFAQGERNIVGRVHNGRKWSRVFAMSAGPHFNSCVDLAPVGEGMVLAAWDHNNDNMAGLGFTHFGHPLVKSLEKKVRKGGYGYRMDRRIFTLLFKPQDLLDSGAPPSLVVQQVPDKEEMIRPRVATDLLGRQHLVAYRFDAENKRFDVVHKMLDPGRGWSPTTVIGSEKTSLTYPPAIVADGDGIVVVWPADGRNATNNYDPPYDHQGEIRLVRVEPPETPTETEAPRPVIEVRGSAPPALPLANEERPSTLIEGERNYLFWGDLHSHSDISPCSRQCDGNLDEKYFSAREEADLDFLMLTDHECSMTDLEWWENQKRVHFYHLPGAFVSFCGYEWGSNPHRHVLHLDDFPPVFRRLKGNQPQVLWEHLEPFRAIVFVHHTAERQFGGSWDEFPPHEKESFAEIFQVRGSYEYMGCPLNSFDRRWQYYRYPGASGTEGINRRTAEDWLDPRMFLQEALRLGYRYGFTAGGEHEGVGRTAVWAKALDRQSLWEALQKRRTYGTTNEKIVLDFRADGAFMGSINSIEPLKGTRRFDLQISVQGAGPIQSLDIVRNGRLICHVPSGRIEESLLWRDDVEPEDLFEARGVRFLYYYARIIQEDGAIAWSSPVWFEET